MFSLFSLKRFCSLGAFVLCAALVFVGCDNGTTDTVVNGYMPLYEEDTQIPSSLIGTWSAQYDSYTLTASTLEYGTYKGTVKFIGYFTNAKDSGVIIYEYLADKKQTYVDYDEDWQVIGGPYDPPGNFHATYFSDLNTSAGTIKMGGAYNSKEPHGCEATTLGQALVKFANKDATTKYFGTPGTYTK